MTDQLLEVLRVADPARNMPPTSSATREAMRERILAAGPDEREGQPLIPTRDLHTRRRLLVAVAVMLIAVIPSGGWVYVSYFGDRVTVVDEFRAAQHHMPLPPGVAWETPYLPADVTYGSQYGFIAAWHQCTTAWLREWMAAHEAGDDARERAAIVAVERQVSLMPLHERGDLEEVGGFDASYVDYMSSLVEEMKQGDPSAVENYFQANP